MAVHHGKLGKVKIGTTNTVAEVTKFSISESVSTADATSMGDTAETHTVGIPSWSGKIEANYDPADTNGQVALTIGASLTLGLYTEGDGTGKKLPFRHGDCNRPDDRCEFHRQREVLGDIKGNGALTRATAA